MARIFISYRREDSGEAAGRMCDRLQARFGRGNVFMDVDSIPCGIDFRQHLAQAVGRCDVLLAVIGERWLEVRYAEGPKQGQRRLDDPEDFVRIEIQSALAREIPVVPVLIGHASMPRERDLPDDLKVLAFRHAAEVRPGRDFRAHVERLARSLDSRRRVWLWAAACGLLLLLGSAVFLFWRGRLEPMPQSILKPDDGANQHEPKDAPPSVSLEAGAQRLGTNLTAAIPRYKGNVHILIERIDTEGSLAPPGIGASTVGLMNSSLGQGPLLASSLLFPGRIVVRWLKLNQAGALPLRKADSFRIEGEVDPPAYLYVMWVDPEHDVTPVYPWDPTKGWGSRPAQEETVRSVSLPRNAGERYIAPEAKDGVATIVLFARPTPLDVPDEVVRKEFEALPDLPLPAGGKQAAVWFDDYIEVRDPDRPRTFREVEANDPFARWQGQLQKALASEAAFQTAVSFSRTGRK